jgi:hypothetical protein
MYKRNEIRFDMKTATRNKKETVLARKFDLNLRKELIKCQIWSIAF